MLGRDLQALHEAIEAIASEPAARAFGLEVLRRGIQSQEGNYTRFGTRGE